MIKYSEIVGTGKYLPKTILKNTDLEKYVDTNDEWISSRTGIKNRRIAVDESLVDMGTKASIEALKSANVNGEEIELIIGATISNDYSMPSLACLIQKEINAVNAMAFDINAACTGFLFALHTANEFIQNGTFKNALIVGCEKMSHLLNWEDRSTCVLFGDGAGAVVVKSSEKKGIVSIESKSLGKDFEYLVSKIKRAKTPFYESSDEDYIKMDGRNVFEFVGTEVPKSINRVIDKANSNIEDVDYFVLHQANTRIISYIAKKLKQDINKFKININEYGNTSAASVPIALDEVYKQQDLTGKKVILAAFGGGLTYGSTLIQF